MNPSPVAVPKQETLPIPSPSTASRAVPLGVLFVGSIRLPSAAAVFTKLSNTLSRHLQCMPDGETGARETFIHFQRLLFEHVPELVNRQYHGLPPLEPGTKPVPLDQVASMLGEIETGYDTAALQSYRVFAKQKALGIIPKHMRFQVCLPTPLNVVSFNFAPQYRAAVEPVYERAVFRAMRNIQDGIPHGELLLQIDMAMDLALLERVWERQNAYGWDDSVRPWYDDVRAGTLARMQNAIDQVDSDVALGLHLCYGDLGHMHFLEPEDTTLIAGLIGEFVANTRRRISYVHFPVPKARDDEAYLEPLRAVLPTLKKSGTHLFVGLMHAGDKQGASRRVQAAKNVLGEDVLWGVSTECGLGRTPEDALDEIIDTAKSLARPWYRQASAAKL